MNAPEKIALLPDIQSQKDDRDLRIDAVGVSGVRYPMTIRTSDGILPTIALLALTVGLPAGRKGTHMSRFIELLEAQTGALDQDGFKAMLLDMLARLGARSGAIEMRFPYFVKKTAPVFARIVRASPASGSTQSGKRQDPYLRLLSLEAAR